MLEKFWKDKQIFFVLFVFNGVGGFAIQRVVIFK